MLVQEAGAHPSHTAGMGGGDIVVVEVKVVLASKANTVGRLAWAYTASIAPAI